jgi:hypothetical protein
VVVALFHDFHDFHNETDLVAVCQVRGPSCPAALESSVTGLGDAALRQIPVWMVVVVAAEHSIVAKEEGLKAVMMLDY